MDFSLYPCYNIKTPKLQSQGYKDVEDSNPNLVHIAKPNLPSWSLAKTAKYGILRKGINVRSDVYIQIIQARAAIDQHSMLVC